MVQALIHVNRLDKALEYVERSRSKRLVDLMRSNERFQDGKIPHKVKDLLDQYEKLQKQIDKIHFNSNNNQEMIGVEVSSRAYLAAGRARNEEVVILEDRKKQLWEELYRENPVVAAGKEVRQLDLTAMHKLISQPTTAILSFYTTTSNTYIFVLRQAEKNPTLHTCREVGFETLQLWVFNSWLPSYMKNKAEWKSKIEPFLAELSLRLQLTELITSLQQDGIKELILIPHLYLHLIPFGALPIKDNKYLGDEFLLRYTPSCQVLEFCQQRSEVEGHLTYGIVENATEDLLFASFEGEQIAQLHQIPNHQRLIGRSQATRENYQQLAKQVHVLHHCHHATSCLDNPLESRLELGDGNIILGQLMTPGWRLPHLSDVFLSCCETGLGVTPVTDDILTLSTGFLCAGARSVVSTLWSVADLPTALFSIFYYQHRLEGQSRSKALWQAQIKLRTLRREELRKIGRQVRYLWKETKSKRNQYSPVSVEYLEWDRKYKKYSLMEERIMVLENSQFEFPFSHPYY